MVLRLTEAGLILNLSIKAETTVREDRCAGTLWQQTRQQLNSFIDISNIILRGYHLVRRSRASRGAGYMERTRISMETTEEEGFFSMNVFTWNTNQGRSAVMWLHSELLHQDDW